MSDAPKPSKASAGAEAARTIGALMGIVMLSAGAGMIYAPAGLIVGGAVVLILAVVGTLRAS